MSEEIEAWPKDTVITGNMIYHGPNITLSAISPTVTFACDDQGRIVRDGRVIDEMSREELLKTLSDVLVACGLRLP